MDGEDKGAVESPSKHGFLQWWVGTKRFLFIFCAFILGVVVETWWFILTNGGQPEPISKTAEILIYPVGLVRGIAWSSMALLGFWFIGYGIKEGWKMISELFKENRFQAGKSEGLTKGRVEGRVEGRAEGLVEGRAESNSEWRGWVERKERAKKQGVDFNEPAPDED